MVSDKTNSLDRKYLKFLIIFILGIFLGLGVGFVYGETISDYISLIISGSLFAAFIGSAQLIYEWKKRRKIKQKRAEEWLKYLNNTLNFFVLHKLEDDPDILPVLDESKLRTLLGNLKELYAKEPEQIDDEVSSSLNNIIESINSKNDIKDCFLDKSFIKDLSILRKKVERILE